jgi:hypothetical protein
MRNIPRITLEEAVDIALPQVALYEYHDKICCDLEIDIGEGAPGFKTAVTIDLLTRLGEADWKKAYEVALKYHHDRRAAVREHMEEEFGAMFLNWNSLTNAYEEEIRTWYGAMTVELGCEPKTTFERAKS